MDSNSGQSGNMPNFARIAREEAFYRGLQSGEKERDKLRAALEEARRALEIALPAATWFCEGPYGHSPDLQAAEHVRTALSRIEELLGEDE